jgi:hypothetical protein
MIRSKLGYDTHDMQLEPEHSLSLVRGRQMEHCWWTAGVLDHPCSTEHVCKQIAAADPAQHVSGSCHPRQQQRDSPEPNLPLLKGAWSTDKPHMQEKVMS